MHNEQQLNDSEHSFLWLLVPTNVHRHAGKKFQGLLSTSKVDEPMFIADDIYFYVFGFFKVLDQEEGFGCQVERYISYYLGIKLWLADSAVLAKLWR